VLVFVYGTLTDPAQAERVLDAVAYGGDATLRGLHRVDGEYPTLAPGGEVAGRFVRTNDVAALDAYEGVGRGLYVRVQVPVADRAEAAAVYVGRPDRLGVAVDWPGAGPFERRVRRYVDEQAVVVDPA
jgi:gamma-glutamylcyclotransferase (GGCT)/AIG2-like uncharacterized protein YtfP